eukprot:TRINITY_DN7281_c0_g1_i1.p1 TRINITY_DN7281_c0_g1~~TRINITY_DN7281_c0_g1_i1.p1  ORF type:complete len:106 (-),score=7.27 TRINITY_DN7281_c0_g1_i1:128-445(-)
MPAGFKREELGEALNWLAAVKLSLAQTQNYFGPAARRLANNTGLSDVSDEDLKTWCDLVGCLGTLTVSTTAFSPPEGNLSWVTFCGRRRNLVGFKIALLGSFSKV